jgi:hypothetical protein
MTSVTATVSRALLAVIVMAVLAVGVAFDRVVLPDDHGYRIVSRNADVTYVGDPNSAPFLQVQTTVGAFGTSYGVWDSELLRRVRDAALQSVRIPVHITYVIPSNGEVTALRIVPS